ncbi:MAG: flagellar filament capping protein FliD [Butyricicoccus sp.]|nr:flagellar filament capping protein FliD [Butyricicoccus sp.]
MASITSMINGSSSSLSSIYGNRNVLSGLASGMDTETMIENAVSGIKLKITNLARKRTRIEWQQEAYRSIIDKAVNFNTKYTSYSSKTNLMSASFFNNAVTTQTLGTYKDKVTASGKSSSEIKINAVKQMATAATYTVSGGDIASTGKISGQPVGLGDNIKVSNLAGTMSIKYGGTNGTSFDISFDELEDLDSVEGVGANASRAEKLAKAIENKLGEITYNYTKNGFSESTTADKAIKVNVDNSGKITFSDAFGSGNSVSVGTVTGDLAKTLGVKSGDREIKVTYDTPAFSNEVKTSDYISGKELKFALNGVSKKITLDNYDGSTTADDIVKDIQGKLDEAYGKGKITVGNMGKNGELALSFDVKEQGSTLSVSGSASKALGLGEDGAANYVDKGKKLSAIFADRADSLFSDANRLKGEGKVTGKLVSGEMRYTDEKGNRVDKDGNRIDSDGNALYDFKVNGVSIAVGKDTTLESLMNAINSNADAGVKVSYSNMTNEFKFTATETGANSKVEFGGLAKDIFEPEKDVEVNHNFADNFGLYLDDGETNNITVKLGKFDIRFNADNKMTMQDFADEISRGSGKYLTANYNEKTGQFTVTDPNGNEQEFSIKDQYGFNYSRKIEPAVTGKYTAGKDAIMDVEVNGTRFENLTRSSNSFDIDGMTINVKGAFNADGANAPDKDGNDYEPVTFNTTTDADKIIEAVRSFVDDYNEMATEIKGAYSTMPAQKSDGSRYEPLTAEEEEGYSESERKAYEEKAKQGILFGDSNMSRMYSQLLSAITPGGTDGQTLREIGIGTSYNNGMTTLSFDEDKLRAALESNPDKVRDAFTKSRESGSSSDGLMANMQRTLNTYVKTTGEPKGVLIQHSGSIKAYTSLNNNSLKTQMDSIDNQIERWQDKMSDQIDRYTTKFSKLEQLIAQMNSQSSALAGLMGGYSGY